MILVMMIMMMREWGDEIVCQFGGEFLTFFSLPFPFYNSLLLCVCVCLWKKISLLYVFIT